MSEHIEYKYRIHHLITSLPHRDYKLALEFLPKLCECTPRTFKEWMYRRDDDKLSIPADAVIKLAVFFCVNTFDMYTSPPSAIETTELYQEFKRSQNAENDKES